MSITRIVNSTTKSIRPPLGGWLERQLSREEMFYLWDIVGEAEKDEQDMKEFLAGNITKSITLEDRDDWFWNNVLHEMTGIYAKEFYNIGFNFPISKNVPYYLADFWVNHQYQTEFNPVHNHFGIYSFVVWMKIPTDYREQKELPIARANSQEISNFQFRYVNMLGEPSMHNYEMAPSREGTMLFFPSKLLHAVYPFYNCDKERVSISGNIGLMLPEGDSQRKNAQGGIDS